MTQWTVSHHRHFVLLTPGNDGIFNGPLLEVIKDLVTGKPTFIGEAPDLFQIVDVEIAHTPGEYFSFVTQLLEGGDRFLQRMAPAPMQKVAIQAVGLEAEQRFFTGFDGCAPPGILRENFGNQKYFVTPPGNRLTNQLLGGSGAVHLSGINVLHAPIEAEAQSGDG